MKRCDRCGEPLLTDFAGFYLDEVAEIVEGGSYALVVLEDGEVHAVYAPFATQADAAAFGTGFVKGTTRFEVTATPVLLTGNEAHLIVHQGCMKEGDEIA